MSNVETNERKVDPFWLEIKARRENLPYWMHRGPWDTDSHLFWLSENMLDFFHERNSDATTLSQNESAALRLAIELFRRAEIRNQKEVRSSRQLEGTGEPCLIEGIEAYKQIKRAMGNPDDQAVNEMLSVGLEVLQSIGSQTPIREIPENKVQKVKGFFKSASDYAFEKMSARHRVAKTA